MSLSHSAGLPAVHQFNESSHAPILPHSAGIARPALHNPIVLLKQHNPPDRSVLTDGFPHHPARGAGMKREWNHLFRMAIPAGALGVAAFTVSSQSAIGFFPPLPPPQTKVEVVPPPPMIVEPPVLPPISPPPFVPPPPPPESPPPVPPPPPPPIENPIVVPEPATVTSGLLGLAVVAGWILRKGCKTGEPEGQ
jgi:hypothetical protein